MSFSGSTVAQEWDQSLHRSFELAGRVCWVRLVVMPGFDDGPKFETTWVPGPPPCFRPGEIAQCDTDMRKAKAAILAYVASLSGASS